MDSSPSKSAWLALPAVGAIVLLANAGLLVLQLTAGKLLAPFVGSSLETWTTVIGIFLAGIAAGNWFGAGLPATRKSLTIVLLLSTLASGWMVMFPELLHATGWHLSLPLTTRIIGLTLVLCFPAGFFLSLLTPLAVRIGTQDVRIGGRIAGLTFALGTLGCLGGNYFTGFWLIPSMTINMIVLSVTGLIAMLSILPWVMAEPPTATTATESTALPPLFTSYVVVFLCSFAGMALELAGVRVMAQMVGVSLFTWTGVIGVMLAGTCLGNFLGGLIADTAGKMNNGRKCLGMTLVIAAMGIACSILLYIISKGEWFYDRPIVTRILLWSFSLFFVPMLLLGMISPQVIRLATLNAGQAGAIAGRVYAVSTIGAIVGTFATGYFLIETFGMFRVILLASLLPIAAWVVLGQIRTQTLNLGLASVIAAIAIGGMALYDKSKLNIVRESNYFTIRVGPTFDDFLANEGVMTLKLDLLIHSWVKPHDPTFLYYAHEQIQLKLLQDYAKRTPAPQTLVIGGGGYTFPRASKTVLPNAGMDVVEIDPAVTDVAYSHLALDRKLGIVSHHMDGRQFVAEKAAKGHYHLITLDAVNDLSVPSHLLTKEFNDQVKKILTPDGAYLVTIIDSPAHGTIWRGTYHTLKQTFPHVAVMTTKDEWLEVNRDLIVLYASDQPFAASRLLAMEEKEVYEPRVAGLGGVTTNALPWRYIYEKDKRGIDKLLQAKPPILFNDQYAPIDWLMVEVFRKR